MSGMGPFFAISNCARYFFEEQTVSIKLDTPIVRFGEKLVQSLLIEPRQRYFAHAPRVLCGSGLTDRAAVAVVNVKVRSTSPALRHCSC